VNPDEVQQAVQGVLAIGTTMGGVWFVLRMVIGFQRDFSDRYSTRIAAQDVRIAVLEAKVERAEAKADAAERAVRECEAREHLLVGRLAEAGVWQPGRDAD